MQELAERVYFGLCLSAGRLLRASRYSVTRIVAEEGEPRVEKSRRPYAPLFVWLGDSLVRLLDTGVCILGQQEWVARERQLYHELRRAPIRRGDDGSLVLPLLAGETLSNLLEKAQRTETDTKEAIKRAVAALAEFHRLGFTHGDAMAENVIIDLEGETACWFDFETVHDSTRTLAWRRADDLRALLVTCLIRVPREELAATIDLVLATYRDPEVTRLLAAGFDTIIRRPLPFHLAQAGLPYQTYRQVGRLLKGRVGA